MNGLAEKFKSVVDGILNLGIREFPEPSEIKRIHLLNGLCLFTLGICFLGILLNVFLVLSDGSNPNFAINLGLYGICATSCAFCFLLSSKGKHAIAGYLLIGMLVALLAVALKVSGNTYGGYLLLYSLLLPVFFFDDLKQILPLSSLSVLTFFFVEWSTGDKYVLPNGDYNLDMIRAHPTFALLAGGLFLMFYHLKNENLKSERALQEEREDTQAIIDSLPMLVAIRPIDGPITMNAKGNEMIGKELAYKIYKRGTDEAYPPEKSFSQRALQGETVHLDDVDIDLLDGSRIPVDVWSSPVKGKDGEIRAQVVAMVDMSENESARLKLLAANSALQLEEHQTRLLRDVAIAVNSNESLEEVIQAAIDSICEYTRWPVGHAYRVDRR